MDTRDVQQTLAYPDTWPYPERILVRRESPDSPAGYEGGYVERQNVCRVVGAGWAMQYDDPYDYPSLDALAAAGWRIDPHQRT